MSNIPDDAAQCPICQRVEERIRSLPMLQGRLAPNEIDELITNVQNAVLKKSIVSRGNHMETNENIVIKKANFDELYEAQKYILLLVEKMADRMEKHDTVLTAFGSQLADVMAKADAFGLDVEEEAPMGEEQNQMVLPGGAGGAPGAPAPACGGAPAAPAPAPAAPAPAAPAPVDPMMGGMAKADAQAFEAGYKAAMADIQKKNGVPTSNMEYPAFGSARPVSAQERASAINSVEKSLSMEDLAKMTPTQLNAYLKEKGL